MSGIGPSASLEEMLVKSAFSLETGFRNLAFKYIFLAHLKCSYNRTICFSDGFRREGTVSTASRNCGNHGQRLQKRETNAPFISGSFGLYPRTLRSERLRWLNNLSGKHQTPCDLGLCKNEPEYKIAAFQGQALSQNNPTHYPLCIGRLEARTGTSPPPSSPQYPRAPP